jgi:hypothetical protein
MSWGWQLSTHAACSAVRRAGNLRTKEFEYKRTAAATHINGVLYGTLNLRLVKDSCRLIISA